MRTLVVNALRLVGKRTAIGRHVEFLAQEWSSMQIPFDRVVFLAPTEAPLPHLGGTTEIAFHVVGRGLPYLLWEQATLARAAAGSALLYCPSYTCPVIYGGRIVIANHGIYDGVAGEFSLLARLRTSPINRMSARRADHLIVNSLSTRADVVRFFGVDQGKTSLVYPAAHHLCFESHAAESIAAEVRRAFGDVVPYVIFVGKMAKRRNVPNLVKAFHKVRTQRGLPHRLLLVGPNTSDLPLDDLIREAGGSDVVRHLPHAEMEQLVLLYAGADVYALPTTHEGISQTMFEAMASGTAVLSVEHSTLAEGGGGAVVSVPTPSVDDIAHGLEMLLTDAAVRRTYEEKGRIRAAEFSWRQTATATMNILDRIAAPRDSSPSRVSSASRFGG